MANFDLARPLVVLCEGKSDQAFLAALRATRQLPPFDLPFPPKEPPKKGEKALFGLDGFVNMLGEIAQLLRLAPLVKLHGVLIAADARDESSETTDYIRLQCQRAGFDPPATRNAWSVPTTSLPPVAIVLIPDSTSGGLESMCLKAILSKNPQVAACLDSFMACVPAVARSAEKRDKAALACVTAAMHPSDPTKSVQHFFGESTPFVDVADPAFDDVTNQLRTLLTSVVPPPVAP